jgi:hypothetical protein
VKKIVKNLIQFNFASYFLYFVIITCVIPTLYFSYFGIYLNYPVATFSIIFSGFLSFFIGYSLTVKSDLVTYKHGIFSKKEISASFQMLLTSIILLLLFFVFLPLRFKYSIGVPDYAPTMEHSGWIYYLSTYGAQAIIIAIFLLTNKKNKNFIIMIVGFLFYSIYQATLGWRLGLLESFIITAVCYSYVQKRDLGRISYSDEFLILSRVFKILFSFIFIYYAYTIVVDLQLEIRNPGAKYTLDSIVTRFWAANYLDNTITYFINAGYDSFTNGENYLFLLNNNMSVAEFNNIMIVGTAEGLHHGNSKSGFGSLYIFGGVLNVVVVYFATGVYFAFIRNRLAKSDLIFWKVISILHVPLLFKIINGGFEMGTIKILIAVWVFSYIGVAVSNLFTLNFISRSAYLKQRKGHIKI